MTQQGWLGIESVKEWEENDVLKIEIIFRGKEDEERNMSQMGQEADGQRKNMFFRNEAISDCLQYSRNSAGLQVKKSLPGLLHWLHLGNNGDFLC